MEVIKDMFPAMSSDVVQSVLEECGGNVERAIDCLLNMESIEGAPTTTSHQPQERQLTQLELDEILARELENSSISNYSPPRRHRQFQEVHTVALDNIDPSVMAEMINSVKSSMIPILLQQLKQLQIPSVEETIDTGKAGQIKLSLDKIQVDDAQVPEESIAITVEGTDIAIAVKDVRAKLQQFKWGYEKMTFPKLKDTGYADASISEATIDVKLKIGGDEYGNPCLKVTHCKVNIGKLDFKITGTLASFVYNTMLAIFKKTIKATLETNFEDMVTSSVNDGGSMNLF